MRMWAVRLYAHCWLLAYSSLSAHIPCVDYHLALNVCTLRYTFLTTDSMDKAFEDTFQLHGESPGPAPVPQSEISKAQASNPLSSATQDDTPAEEGEILYASSTLAAYSDNNIVEGLI
ncbi:uncharacterized protein LAESUDRAFT_718037 [Laetiporus sulphureus 93-53]|uniref:Uncharacterized protein n=1 Tax=Laetiporus sulphureus 93-53 TaxID=1314785 RepID=A0A165BAI2_9APHY|nr:uncharacterized protein LAESUDRAFT_718037 [Laetiporus sulphureus 93-53]KZT00620.1 hypothetical protein LAESUDRAFT_718037 [Laetiporus sulphureus 93-53]